MESQISRLEILSQGWIFGRYNWGPKVKIGSYEVGPVLFSQRPDENWSQGMIATMDKVVQGAIGGSVLKYFKVTIDYNSELIRLEK